MITVFRSSWAILLGMMLLMVGNGLQGTLLGVRGDLEGFSTGALSIVMSGYFAGFLIGSRLAPEMIRRVGHVRVFAALGSLISAALIMFPTITDPITWTLLRVLLGFCFSGVYVTAESWLNNSTSNETRGQALSLYIIMQMVGIIAAQGILALGDPSGFVLFVIPSVLVSLAFLPMLLSASPTPAFESTKPLTFAQLYAVSPLGCIGIFLLGGVFAALFGMTAVYGTEAGLSLGQISLFVSMIYTGGLVLQFPIGWISDRFDRRTLIVLVAFVAMLASFGAMTGIGGFYGLLLTSFLIGGMANPLYALLLAYTNDYLDNDDMAAASGRLIAINGTGAILGPLAIGWMMTNFGAAAFFGFIAVLMGMIGAYGLYRMTQRAAPDIEDTGLYQAMMPTATSVAMELAQEVWIDEDTAQTEARAEAKADAKAEAEAEDARNASATGKFG